jgi:hypothetical protein
LGTLYGGFVSDLGVADHIGDQPARIGELASSCGVDPDGLDRVLRLLTTHGIFQRQHGSYGHTPSSLLLRSDHPMTLRACLARQPTRPILKRCHKHRSKSSAWILDAAETSARRPSTGRPQEERQLKSGSGIARAVR